MSAEFSFIAVASVLVIGALTMLLWPLLRASAAGSNDAAALPALRILREQRAELDADLAAGRIDAASHTQAMSELEVRAIEEDALTGASQHGSGRRHAWAVALGVLLPAATIALYFQLGRPEALRPAIAAATSPNMTAEQIDAMVAKLAERVRTNPDDVEGMRMLGRSYMVLGRYVEAVPVLQKLAMKQPDAQVYADLADAVASLQQRSLSGAPEKLLAKALQLDPQNIKALALSGTLAFEKKDYQQAIEQWQKIAARVPAESEFGQSVQAMLQEARNRAGGAAPEETPTATPPLQMRGRITLAPALAQQVAADDALFVFARPEAGGPPLAGMRFKASELPVDFDFARAQLMMGVPDAHANVIIGARVSRHGNALPQPGDLQGFSKPVSVDAKDLRIDITEVVK